MSRKSILGLIPARGGSKGIHQKNLHLFNKKPLIQWTIEAALESNLLDKIIVSTDDIAIANFSKGLGVDVPFLREKSLAKDESLIMDTILNLIEKLEYFDDLLLLQPTSPLRTKVDIVNIIKMKEENKTESLVSVCEVRENPALFYNLNKDNFLSKSFKNLKGTNRQVFKKYYLLNGALYLSSIEHLKKYKSFISDKTMAYIMPVERSIDIDHQIDINWGEFLIKNKK
tara:strand:- start:1020 stop:1703 length:684 start_codon:yes stop_codon:yes gene_type:complete